jgi:hypothetical protein
MTTDKGPEIGWQYAIQDGLRFVRVEIALNY